MIVYHLRWGSGSGIFILAQRHHAMGRNQKIFVGGGPLPTVKVKIFVRRENEALSRGRTPPRKAFLLTFCPRRQKVTKNAFGERVNAEVATLCVPTSIACQRYHTPDSPHLRHGRPPRCSLVADSAQIGRIKDKKRVEECFCPFLPQKLVTPL